MNKAPRPKRKSKAGPSAKSALNHRGDKVKKPSAALRSKPRPEISLNQVRNSAPESSVTARMQEHLLNGKVVHFPYPSGWLHYDCNTCDAPCCRGGSIGISRSKELVTLQSVQENLALFASPRFDGSAMVSLDTPREGCWFLDKKSRCRLEKTGGRSAKPASCRLFPFHRLRQAGEFIFVLPDFSCPIEIYAPQQDAPKSLLDEAALKKRKLVYPNDNTPAKHFSSSPHSEHDVICLEMNRVRLPNKGHPHLPHPRDLPWEKAAKLERRILDTLPLHLDDLDYLGFALAQQKLTAAALGHVWDEKAIKVLDKSIRVFLGVLTPTSADSVRDLIVLSGILRLMASQLPRREMPGVLVALNVLISAYENMHGARRSVRTIVSLFESRLPFLYTLSHLSHRPILQDDSSVQKLLAHFPALRESLGSVLHEIEQNRGRSVALSLREILDKQGALFQAPLSPDAVTLIFGLGQVLMQDGIFVPV